MNIIKIYKTHTTEYKKLDLLLKALNILKEENNLDVDFYISDVYFDYGQNWMWTTILCKYKDCIGLNSSYQILNPAQYEKILFQEMTGFVEVYEELKKEILRRHYKNN